MPDADDKLEPRVAQLEKQVAAQSEALDLIHKALREVSRQLPGQHGLPGDRHRFPGGALAKY